MGSIPAFRLYGEQSDWWETALLHVESIASRSRLHNWRIKPHRHSNLYQLLYLQQGNAGLTLEGQAYQVTAPCILWVPPLSVHGFQFAPDVQGWVLTLLTPLVERLAQAINQLFNVNKPPWRLSEQHNAQIAALFTALQAEYHYSNQGRQAALEAWLNLLLVWLQRHHLSAQTSQPPPTKSQAHFQRFSRLVERHYRQQWRVQQYARETGISVTRLNHICQQFGHQTAQAFIHRRLLLEARRELIYTARSMGQISDSLGFSEAAYFSRFFKRLTGMTPNQFKQRYADRSAAQG